jgi:hypothetical protein
MASSIARDELEKIPVQYRNPHLAQYSLLGELSSGQTTWADPVSRESAVDPVYQALLGALPDRLDAEYIFQAHSSKVTTFLTTDAKTILRHRARIRSICEVNVMLPSEFVAGSSLTSACSWRSLHFKGTLHSGRADKSPQLMRGPLGGHAKGLTAMYNSRDLAKRGDGSCRCIYHALATLLRPGLN